MAFEGYFFEEQLAKYQIQFTAIFDGLVVKTGKRENGEDRYLPVPTIFGTKDRVTAALLGDNTQNAMLRLPLMSANMKGLNIALDRMKGSGTERRFTYFPKGGEYPKDIKTVKQRMPIPFDMTMELMIYASNQFQHRQILEQILVFFDPILQIQKNDQVFDWTKITTVELTDISLDENYPVGAEKRNILTTIQFKVPIYLSVPSDVKNNFVNQIFARLHVLDMQDSIEEYMQNLDAITTPYDLIADGGSQSVPVGENCGED